MPRLVTALWRWFVPLAVGILVGGTLVGDALAEFNVGNNCAVTPVRFVIDGVDKTLWHNNLPDGNPGAFICNGRTYLPIRWLGETLGKAVNWDPTSYTVQLSGSTWTNNGVSVKISNVQIGSKGTALTVYALNTTDEQKVFTFTVTFKDGAGHPMGTVSGPETPVVLEAGGSQAVTAVSQSDLSGYVSLTVSSVVTPGGLYSIDSRTGIAEIDRVLEALVTRDDRRLGEMIAMTKVPCRADPSGMSTEPRCPQGTADGTPIDVFPVGACQPNYVFSLEVARNLITDTLRDPLYIYAVYEATSNPIPGGSPGYGIVAATRLTDPTAKTIYVDRQGTVRMLHRGCGTPDAATPRGANFILLPKTRK